jgi:hypothetical protein
MEYARHKNLFVRIINGLLWINDTFWTWLAKRLDPRLRKIDQRQVHSKLWHSTESCVSCHREILSMSNFCRYCGSIQWQPSDPQIKALPAPAVRVIDTTGPQHIVTRSLPVVRRPYERPVATYNRVIKPVIESMKTGDLDDTQPRKRVIIDGE